MKTNSAYISNNAYTNEKISSLVKPVMTTPSTNNRFELINNPSNDNRGNNNTTNKSNFINIIDASNLN